MENRMTHSDVTVARDAGSAAHTTGYIAAVIAAALAFAPWAHVSVKILGLWSPALDLRGVDLGSQLGDFPYGWVVIGCSAAAIFGLATRSAGVALAGALVALALTGYNAATMTSHTVQATVGGTNVDDLVGARVTVAWGTWAELLAAAVLLAACIAAARRE